MTGENRKMYLDNLRFISCILVVGVHVSAFAFEKYPVDSVSFFFANAYDCLSIIGVPLFVMISGALMLRADYQFSYKKILCRKIPHILIVYFLWLSLYNVVNCIIEGYGFSVDFIKDNIILNTLEGYGIYHLWFLPMIVGLYLLLPIYRSFAQNERLCRYFLLLYFVVTILFPTILKFEFPFKRIVQSLYERIPFSMVLGYSGYFILGHYLDTFVQKLKRKHMIAIVLIGFLAFQINHLTCFYLSIKTKELSVVLNDPLTVPDFCIAIAVFLLVKELLNHSYWVTKYGKYSLGIYLIHPLLLMIIEQIGLEIAGFPSVIVIPIMTLVIYVISFALIFLLSKCPGLRKIVL